LAPWPKEVSGRPDTFADRLFAHFQQIHRSVGLELPLSMILWMASRLRTADASSVLRYALLIRPHVSLAHAEDVFSHAVVKRFRQRMLALRGRHRQAFRPTVCVTEYKSVLADESIPPLLRAVILLAWRRAARVADILETRCGGLWEPQSPEQALETLWFEQPFSKTQQAGSWDRLLISVTPAERSLLDRLALISPTPPTLPPQRRPLMFHQVFTSGIAEALARSLGRRVGAHSLRRSALLTAVEAGVPLAEAVLLSLHSSVASAAAYVLRPDVHVAATMAHVSRSTTAPPLE
jgi:integrase